MKIYKVVKYGLIGMEKEFKIKSKSLSNESINIIDLAMQNYYNPAINYLSSLDD